MKVIVAMALLGSVAQVDAKAVPDFMAKNAKLANLRSRIDSTRNSKMNSEKRAFFERVANMSLTKVEQENRKLSKFEKTFKNKNKRNLSHNMCERKENDESCDNGNECKSYYCPTGTCKARPTVGEDTTDCNEWDGVGYSGECDTGRCDVSTMKCTESDGDDCSYFPDFSYLQYSKTINTGTGDMVYDTETHAAVCAQESTNRNPCKQAQAQLDYAKGRTCKEGTSNDATALAQAEEIIANCEYKMDCYNQCSHYKEEFYTSNTCEEKLSDNTSYQNFGGSMGGPFTYWTMGCNKISQQYSENGAYVNWFVVKEVTVSLKEDSDTFKAGVDYNRYVILGIGCQGVDCMTTTENPCTEIESVLVQEGLAELTEETFNTYLEPINTMVNDMQAKSTDKMQFFLSAMDLPFGYPNAAAAECAPRQIMANYDSNSEAFYISYDMDTENNCIKYDWSGYTQHVISNSETDDDGNLQHGVYSKVVAPSCPAAAESKKDSSTASSSKFNISITTFLVAGLFFMLK